VLSGLLGELTSGVSDLVVALRGPQRLVQTFEPLPLPPVPEGQAPGLRPGGVYLLTGGLGGIGLAMAEYLARTVRARLVLLGRSGLPPRERWAKVLAGQGPETALANRIRGVQRLEELSSEVLVVEADVTREDQVRRAVQQAVERFGTVHGVLHTAGVPGAGLIQLKTPEMAAAVMAPKVQGTLALERSLRGIELDFLALFSSITSVTGALGQVDYVAANAFLDAYALSRLGEKRLTMAIDWNEWQWNAWEAGLNGFQEEVKSFFTENRKQFGIRFEEGAEAFQRILAGRVAQVVVSPQDFGAFAQVGRRFTLDAVVNWGRPPREAQGKKYPRPVLGMSYVAPGSALEEKIAAVWGDVLGIEEVGIQDNFFDLGGNSLIGLALVARLRQELATHALPMHVLYEAPTVSALARLVQDDRADEATAITERFARGQEHRQRLRERRRDT
jgi:NAD(P)-dependent dehydrogenase (short-subunit alcohol dehydrogenase family)